MVIEVRPDVNAAQEKIGDRSRQQIFLSKDALLLYYAKYYTYTDRNDHRQSAFSRTFVRVPYSAEYKVSGATITFTGDLCSVKMKPSSLATELAPEDAETYGKEATLTCFNPGKPDNSEKILGTDDPEMVQQITSAFDNKGANIPETEDISSWRILLDRYVTEKRGNLDTSDTVIQTYWFADYLARRRQARLGVKASQIFDPKGGPDSNQIFIHKQGRCRRTSVHTQGEMTYKYELENDKLEFSTKLPPIFSIVSTDDTPESRICPNCGNEVKTEESLEGCPSCGTQFRLTDYDFKISGESLFHTKMKNGRLFFGILGVTMIVSILINILTSPPQPLPLLIIQSLFSGVFLGMIVYFILVIPIGIFLMTRIAKDSRFPTFCHRMRQKDPNLSTEEFEAEVQSRIRTFFLSESTDDIRFVSGAKPGQFADIVDVRIKEYKKIALVPNNDFQIIRAHVVLDLIRVKGGKLVREKGNFAFDIYRLASAKTELKTDKEIFTCPSCASSLSILDGGRCKFCGKTTDLSRFGWVLGAVQAE